MTLIPEVKCPERVYEFHPISFGGDKGKIKGKFIGRVERFFVNESWSVDWVLESL